MPGPLLPHHDDDATVCDVDAQDDDNDDYDDTARSPKYRFSSGHYPGIKLAVQAWKEPLTPFHLDIYWTG